MRTLKLSLFICTMMLLATACQNQKEDPYVNPGNVPDPQWTVNVENNMSASMTGIVRVGFSEAEGTLAAFMGDACCGVAEYINGLYYIYISPATEEGGDVRLRFYSPALKRIFVASETQPFKNDAQLGTASDPYTPSWTVEPNN